MCDMGFEIGWQVDNVDSAEWTFLWANSASDTKTFRDEGNFRFGRHFDAKTSTSHNWTRLLAFLPTFLAGPYQYIVSYARVCEVSTFGLHCVARLQVSVLPFHGGVVG